MHKIYLTTVKTSHNLADTCLENKVNGEFLEIKIDINTISAPLCACEKKLLPHATLQIILFSFKLADKF